MAIKYTKKRGGPLDPNLDALFDAVSLVSDGKICGVDGCDRSVAGRGLCRKHYARVKRHGRIDGDDKHNKKNHPLHKYWNNLRQTGRRAPEWKRFWTFVADVGERPSKFHMLRRIDKSKPLGRGNCEWRVPELIEGIASGKVVVLPRTTRTDPTLRDQKRLAKKYGITVEEYRRILDAQGGKCAVCKEHERIEIRAGRKFSLAVDHDHETGAVRGILCSACNRAIGLMKDDPRRLIAAARYLEDHIKIPKGNKA